MNWAIEANQVTKSFPVQLRLRQLVTQLGRLHPRRTALHPVSLSVPTGGAVALLGPNGAGKTTLTKLLALLLEPDTGEVRIGGCDSRHKPYLLRQKLAYVGERGLYERLSARENLYFFAQTYGLKNSVSRIQAVLRQVELWEVVDLPVQKYSTGMRQRLAIARALLHQPELLFLDEPTRGIDPTGCEELYQLLMQLRHEQGLTLVLCTQILYEAERLTEALLFLDQGQVLAQGNVADLAQRFQLGEQVVIELATPVLPGVLGLPYLPLELGLVPACQFTFAVPTGQHGVRFLQELLQHLQGVEVVACRTQQPDLEQVYRVLLNRPKSLAANAIARPDEPGQPECAITAHDG